MYLYLYDSFLNNKKYGNLLAKIETRLTDLGVGGKIFRLSPLRNTGELLNDEIKNGVKTVIVVGNDKSFTEVINVAAKLDVTLGIIPVGANNTIAKMLGIGSPNEATDIIASRILERMDLGKANGVYFLSNISVPGGQVTIECENKFRLTPHRQDLISICNLRPLSSSLPSRLDGHFNPRDGLLEILVQPAGKGFFKRHAAAQSSIVPFKEIAIRSRESIPILTDGKKVLKTPVTVKIVPKKLRVIVGKNRMF